jgi:ABC-2 type transport system ATP-binding protein
LELKLRRQFDLPGRRPLEHLSRGMTMKAALLAALSFRPKLLVLDEPFSGLDPLARDEFTRGLLEASTEGDWTILVSTHDIEEVERLCDWVGMIERGPMRIAESTESLLSRYRRVEAVNVPSFNNIVPDEWLDFERADGAVKFADRRYVAGQSETAYASAFGGAPVQVRPMTLREIFIAEARSSRALGKEVK